MCGGRRHQRVGHIGRFAVRRVGCHVADQEGDPVELFPHGRRWRGGGGEHSVKGGGEPPQRLGGACITRQCRIHCKLLVVQLGIACLLVAALVVCVCGKRGSAEAPRLVR